MKKRSGLPFIIALVFMSLLECSTKELSYKVTIYRPEKKIYYNVSNLKYSPVQYSSSGNLVYASKILEFYRQPNNQHVIVGEDWIAEENFK